MVRGHRTDAPCPTKAGEVALIDGRRDSPDDVEAAGDLSLDTGDGVDGETDMAGISRDDDRDRSIGGDGRLRSGDNEDRCETQRAECSDGVEACPFHSRSIGNHSP